MKQILTVFLSLVVLGAGCSSNQGLLNNVTTSRATTSRTELNLSNKALTAISMDVFSQTELTSLDLSNNRLTGAPPSQIGQLVRLQSLDLSGNALTGLPAELGRLDKLEVLNVANNRLTGLPMELGNLTQLRILDVSGNPYSTQDLDAIAAKLTKTEIRR